MCIYIYIYIPLATPNPATAYGLLEARRVEAFPTGLEIPVSIGFWWHGVVWCYLNSFLSGTVCCAHFVSTNPIFFVTLGSCGGHFGTLCLHFGGLGLLKGPQGDPLQSKLDF